MSRKKTLNLHKDDMDWRGRALCPLADKPFEFDKCHVRTIEGFMHTIRLPLGDARRVTTLMDTAHNAKRAVVGVPCDGKVRWDGTAIAIGSPAYDRLIERMLRARFRKDRHAIAALAASRGMKFVHKRPTTRSRLGIIPAKRYCALLTRFRKELLQTGEIAREPARAK